MHILHSLPAALIRRGNIDPVHKIMQYSGRQFLQIGVFLRPEEELRHECRKRLTPELAAILRRWESALYNEKICGRI